MTGSPRAVAEAAGTGARAPERVRHTVQAALAHPLMGMPLRTAALIGLAAGLERGLTRAAALPETAYRGGFFPAAQIRVLVESGAEGIVALAAAALLLAAALRARSLGPAWRDLDDGPRLRVLVGTAAALLAWVFATYDYNYWFARPHGPERALLAASVPLLLWRPAFTLVFLGVLVPTGAQFFHPIGGFSWAPYHVPIRVVFLFAAWWLLRLATPRVRAPDLIFVVCCMIAAHYWISGEVGSSGMSFSRTPSLGTVTSSS